MKVQRPYFLITIDTEGDNLWSQPKQITTENARFLPRFQNLCESFGFKPTYLTNFEMAMDPKFRQVAGAALEQGSCEIGMHLHAWNSPPIRPLTNDDMRHQPYLIEYPDHVIEEKVAYMTQLLGDTFAHAPLSHRAGRWSTNAKYLQILFRHGYRVDCSVTPHVSFKSHRGDPAGAGGTDYRRYPGDAYFVNLNDPSQSGDSDFLEIPMTIVPDYPAVEAMLGRLPSNGVARHAFNRVFKPNPHWLRPTGGNLDAMRQLLRAAIAEGRDYVEFMLHSSEFMPGGSPTFATSESIEKLYQDLGVLFKDAAANFRGATLTEFYDDFVARSGRERRPIHSTH